MGEFAGNRLEEPAHEGRAINPIGHAGAGEVQAPAQRCAVGREMVECLGQRAEFRFMPAHGDRLGVREVERHAAGLPRPVLASPGERHVVGDQQAGSQHIQRAVRIGGGLGLAFHDSSPAGKLSPVAPRNGKP
jgi:hypothetical protein